MQLTRCDRSGTTDLILIINITAAVIIIIVIDQALSSHPHVGIGCLSRQCTLEEEKLQKKVTGKHLRIEPFWTFKFRARYLLS